MDKRKLKIALSLAVLIPCVLYAAGIIAQFIININAWKAAGSDYRTSPGLPSSQISEVVRALFHFPEGLIAIGVVVLGIAVLCVFGLRIGWGQNGVTDSDRNLTVSNSGSYGTASFMSPKEASACFEVTSAKRTSQDILGMLPDGQVLTLPKDTRLNANLAVCGSSGTGKSRAISRNLVLQAVKRGESVILTDPKSELYESMGEYLRENGYIVKVFNLVEMDHSDSWNCLGEVGSSELMAQTFADIVLQNTSGDSKDAFWYNAELNLLKALVLYVALEMPPGKRNIATVYDLLYTQTEKGLSDMMASISHEHANQYTGELLPPSPASAPYAIFRQSSETVRTSVIIGLGSKLAVLQAQQVRNITSYNEIDLELPGKQKCAYFCIVSDQDSTYDFLSSLFFSFLFIRLIRYADAYCEGGMLHPKVKFILDEFPNCCLIPDFTKKCSTIRSRGCSVAVFFQNVGQMRNRYPDDQWQEILGACDSTVFLGCTDMLTAEYFSDRIGTASVEVEGTMRELNTMHITDYTPRFRKTNSLGRRPLLTPDEVLRLPPDQVLIFIRGQKVMRAKRFDYSLHPDYTTPVNACVKDGETTTVEITNQRMASIMIHKIDAATGAGIYGVKFVLYDSGKNPIGEYTTDQDGYIYIDDELVPGKYYLRELEAADGYIRDEQYKTVYVERGKCAQIEWENSAVTGQIQIRKYSSEDNTVTGQLAGTPLEGAVFEITQARSGKVVGYIVTDARGVAASGPLPLGRYFVTEVSAPKYYQLSGEKMEAEIEYPSQIIKLSAYNKPASLGVTIKKSGNYEVQSGQTMSYDFSGIANTSNVALNHFFWHDHIPTDATRALSISTGTYNARLYYKVTFKTNLNDYRTLASNLLTSNNYSLSLNAATLRLVQGEYVTDVRFEFGTVPSGFSSVVKPTMRVQVLGTVSNGYQIINRADVGGQYLNEWQTAKTTWVTTVRRFNTTPLPKTGY